MDFALTSDQEDIRSLAEKIFSDFCKVERLPDFEKAGDRFDRELWSALAEAGLLGVAIATEDGGMGFGIAELCVLLEQAGRFAAPIPLLPALAMGAATISAFGSPEQKGLLARVASGQIVLTAALAESDTRDPAAPTTKATPAGDGFTLEGVKICVPAARRAERVLVPASTASGDVVVALVAPDADGVALEEQETTTGDVFYRMSLAGVRVSAADLLGGAARGRDALAHLLRHTTAALCATELGAAEKSLRLTAKYTTDRKQFSKPIATFQAVAQRAADAYIDVEAIRLTTWQAVWRLSAGLPADRELAIAKFWASEGGHRACYAAQHLHGGIGVDKDYPLHRYYLLSKQIELTLGGAHESLAKVGALLATA